MKSKHQLLFVSFWLKLNAVNSINVNEDIGFRMNDSYKYCLCRVNAYHRCEWEYRIMRI